MNPLLRSQRVQAPTAQPTETKINPTHKSVMAVLSSVWLLAGPGEAYHPLRTTGG